MGELQVATEFERADCSWSRIIEAIRRHAGSQPQETAAELNAWADLLEGGLLLDRPGASGAGLGQARHLR